MDPVWKVEQMDDLDALGAAPGASTTYGRLAELGQAGVDTLSDSLGEAPEVVAAAVSSLVELGLVVAVDDEFQSTSPRVALEGVALSYTRRAGAARAAADRLGPVWSLNQGRADYLEVVPGMEAARGVQEQVFSEATHRIRALSIGSEKRPRMAEGLAAALQSGIRVQAVYGAQVLRHPAAMEVVRSCIALGQESRVFPMVPMNLLMADDHLAMLVVRVPSHRRADGLVIHPSDLFDSMIGLFEAFWRLAIPVSSGSDVGLMADSPETVRLLTNLAAGLTDRAIASDLQVSERTVRRRISELQRMLGAQTRFQMGIQAVRHGWL